MSDKITNLLLVKCEQDQIIFPQSTEWFSDDGKDFKSSILFNTKNLGLKELYDDNKINFCSVDVKHVKINQQFFTEVVEPCFKFDNTNCGVNIACNKTGNIETKID